MCQDYTFTRDCKLATDKVLLPTKHELVSTNIFHLVKH